MGIRFLREVRKAASLFRSVVGNALGLQSLYNIIFSDGVTAMMRQDYLETALDWLSGGQIEHYMAAHQHDQNANELWTHFQNVIN